MTKRVQYLHFLILLPFFYLSSSIAFSLQNKIEPYNLSAVQKEEIEKDSPLQDLKLDKTSLWILGQNFLWFYSFKSKSLEKISFKNLESISNFNSKILEIEGSIFLVNDTRVFQIDKKKRNQILYYETLDTESLTLSLQSDEKLLYWFKTSGLQTIDLTTKKSIDFKTFYIPQDKKIFLHKLKTFFFVENNKFYQKEIDEKKSKLLYEMEEKAESLQTNTPWIQINTESQIYLFSKSGKFIQKIQVQGNRKILANEISSKRDSYLYDDFLVEIKDKENHKTFFLALPKLGISNPKAFSVNQKAIALLVEGQVFLFKNELL